MTTPANGTMRVQVLADGTVRSQTGDMAGVNHQSADGFLTLLAQLMGGAVAEEKLAQGRQHTHTHADGTTHRHQ